MMSGRKIAVMQPYLFPYIGYFQLIHAVDVFVFYDDVNYIKGGWINRNYIQRKGVKQLITVPVKRQSSFKLINEIKVDRSKNWQIKILKSIEYSYKKRPFFKDVYPLVESLFTDYDIDSISEMAIQSISLVLDYLGLKKELKISSSYQQGDSLNKTERLLDICMKENANIYINSIGGRQLYSKDEFKRNSVDLYFLDPINHVYSQSDADFVPGLSIIDVIMNNPKCLVQGFIERYKLI